MNRDEKAAIVAELNESFNRAKFSVVADYCGLTVADLEKIRRDLRETSSEIRIAKNTLLRLAVTETSCESLSDDFTGTTAIVVSYDDPVAPAKVLAKCAEDYNKFQLRSAVLEGEKITVDDLVALSKLPSKEVLLGQLLSVMNGVPTAFVRVLSAVPQKLLYGLQAVKDQKEQA
ncbi:MAG: 50S ribosomal protein L10 [Desulfofustis sp.]|nr:50S ribosomal protein L10 [Desulfofustis sp.]NNF46380.1 50S ribosomal protein L10 [Desulfofustis sp.]NNK57567.1 50S ribosomal protein L10 [Desulfofustis sp.]